MDKRLFLLDGMALVYRAHFALISRPIFNSKGLNTSALYVFTQTLLDVINTHKPTHIAIAFDSSGPTQRHRDYADYKSQRQSMPEDLSVALPHVRRIVEAFNIPILKCEGYEADDVIGTVVCRARTEGFTCYMVTPDKDFGQLVAEGIYIYRPSRMGDAAEIFGVPEILAKWGITRPEQVADVLALWGDTSDNIPGVPGIGEKTASKLISEYGSVENLLERTTELKGKLQENLRTYKEQALLSKKLATIICDVPCPVDLESLKAQSPNEPILKQLLAEFEFKSIARRLFPEAGETSAPAQQQQQDLITVPPSSAQALKSRQDLAHDYKVLKSPDSIEQALREMRRAPVIALHVQIESADPRSAAVRSISFSSAAHSAVCIPLAGKEIQAIPGLRELLESEEVEKIGHGLKFACLVLRWHGIQVRGSVFDTEIAHALVEPDLRHQMADVAGTLLQRQYVPEDLTPEAGAEAADLAWQCRPILEACLKTQEQEQVFFEIEMPLLPVLVDMEFEGIRIDAVALAQLSEQLGAQLASLEQSINRLAGHPFNINSPRQLGEVLFQELRICEKPKKTKTGQYATDEQTLVSLESEHEIVRQLLDYRMLTKLKSTYVDALPASIWSRTGRVHTTYTQVATATGRLSSINPNLQNIPIRSERGQEIRKAFVPRDQSFVLLSADYSQIELRIIAALSNERGLIEAFAAGIDVHTATAAKVFGVALEEVTAEMRRKAKMVNYGIAYGMSEFGLAQRLGIPRAEASSIIGGYFKQFVGVQNYMSETVDFARTHGYVRTVTGRRRYLRDIRSKNGTIRASAERNAINAPIQGTAADMIKIAMVNLQREIARRKLRSRMLLQVHDELVFDVFSAESEEMCALVSEKMRTALSLPIPIEVEIGTGRNWLEAH